MTPTQRRSTRIWLVLALSASLSLVMIPARAATLSWHVHQTPGPGWISDGSMAYDGVSKTVLMFGGWDGTVRNETWSGDGSSWTLLHPSASPSPRANSVMVSDTATGEIVLFGGADGSSGLNDTWTWDGTNWTQQHPSHSPPPLYGAQAAYDSHADQVVVFGGLRSATAGAPVALAQTWTWDGTTWTRAHPATSPPPRWAGSMAYDPSANRTVLFGGTTDTKYPTTTWTWDGTTWTRQRPTTSPPPRAGTAMAFNPALHAVVLFGGGKDGACLGDTWLWTGGDWTELLTPNSPRARAGHAMAFDDMLGELVMYGGNCRTAGSAYQSTWTL